MQPYYLPLKYDHNAIQQQSAKLALEMDLIHNPIVSTSNPLSADIIKTWIPDLQKFLDAYNFDLLNAGLMVTKELSTTGIFSEIVSYGARVELPVIGCDYSHTAYYNAPRPQRVNSAATVNYWLYDSETAVEVDRLVLRQPTVINTRIPRCTTVTRPHVRRISLMLSVGPIAYTMLHDSSQ